MDQCRFGAFLHSRSCISHFYVGRTENDWRCWRTHGDEATIGISKRSISKPYGLDVERAADHYNRL